MNKQQYTEYLQSDHWQKLRARKKRRVRKTAGKVRCAICGTEEQIETHHLQYRNIYDVLTSDLRLLCRRCHQVAHDLMGAGILHNKYSSHHAMFGALKSKVKKQLGLTGKNLFYPR